jgi:chromosome segregation and condensation protein ScpB
MGIVFSPTLKPKSTEAARYARMTDRAARRLFDRLVRLGDAVAELTRTETFALTAIAYLQPVTRGEISRLAGREISRDIIAALKRHGLIDGAIRSPESGTPFAYVTTKTFLEAFGFATLRDLPDLEPLKAEGLRQAGQVEDYLDSALGLAEEGDEDGNVLQRESEESDAGADF